MKNSWIELTVAGVVFAAAIALPSPASAVDVSTLFSNAGFESGNLSGWKLTRPNPNYVGSLSPAVNPIINPADPANNPATLTAPQGSKFTGLKRPGDNGPDLAYKLAHNVISLSVPTGTTFEITVFANRGRLEPYDTPGSTGDVQVRIFGWKSGTVPTVNTGTDNWSRTVNWNPPSQFFDFTGIPDGTWGSQTFAFDPAALGFDTANLAFLSVSIAARNHNHDEFVAIDVGPVAPQE